jgi:hypothetical protein
MIIYTICRLWILSQPIVEANKEAAGIESAPLQQTLGAFFGASAYASRFAEEEITPRR